MTVRPPKPAILCLHGSGTNSMIFNIQTIRIQRLLLPYFDFVFPSAPFEVSPGPGVLPTFAGCGPYYRWITEAGQLETPAETRELMHRVAAEQKAKDGRGFVGVWGFSQGCRLATGLLLEEQCGKQKKLKPLSFPLPSEDDDDEDYEEEGGLKFGIFTMGTSPPLASDLSDDQRKIRIRCPTLTVTGVADPHRDSGRRIYDDHCEKENARFMEFDVGHRLPESEADSAAIAREILRMYRETSSTKAREDFGVSLCGNTYY